jgi:kynurenine 3-monooxygenase
MISKYPVLALLSLLCLHFTLAFVPSTRQQHHRPSTTSLFSASQSPAPEFKVAVVGGGPAGLLLSHLLLQQENIQVSLLESRSDPRKKETEERAYALGLGIRGRTAIRQVDEDLWQAVRKQGYESERFQLHIGPLIIPLRSEADASSNDQVEPSLLLFQSNLCGALTEELDRRHGAGKKLQLYFDQKVETCDLNSMRITTQSEEGKTPTIMGPFDLIVGCDGVNSVVRQTIEKSFASFESHKERLPGEFKVVRLDSAPPKVDPTSVSLIFPKSGSTTAFFEPTSKDGGCCVLFAGKGVGPLLSNTNNVTAIKEALQESFPQWKDSHGAIAAQLMAQKMAGIASSVTCNTYHYGAKAVLTGDAAHATGGISGQGVNSALMDSVVLAECIQENRDNVQRALLTYSQRQVPEGKALYDLSFGPKPSGFKGILWAFLNARDTLFRGRWGIGQPPLQTRLTTSLASFSEIRRERDTFYPEPFPALTEFDKILAKLDKEASQ